MPCRYELINSGADAIPRSCQVCGFAGACHKGLTDPYKPATTEGFEHILDSLEALGFDQFTFSGKGRYRECIAWKGLETTKGTGATRREAAAAVLTLTKGRLNDR